MKLNRTKILVIVLVGITILLGGVALYIANRLQTQIQTPSSAATITPPPQVEYKCKVIYYKDAAFTQKYEATDTVEANKILELYISRTATGAFTNVGVNNVSLKKGTTRIAGIQTTGNNYHVSVPADQISNGANVFEFGYNIVNNNVATGDWCEPYTITGKAGTTSSSDPICSEMKIGIEGGAAPAKLNTRTTGILLTSSQKLVVTATYKNVPVEEVRKLLLYNAQNIGTVGNNSSNPFVSYNASDSAVQTAKAVASTTAGEVTFSYKLAYSDLFKTDTTALQNVVSPAETPQWTSGIPYLVKIGIPVKVGTSGVANTYSADCMGYVKRQAITVSTVNTSTAACVGLTIGKNGGTQTKKNTRTNPLLLTTGDTLNITHTLSNVPATENSRTLRMYNAQNISADGNNTLNSFTSYYSADSTATKYVATKVANGNNYDFKYTLSYADLFKADTTALVKAATPAETPQWASGGIPNLIKIAVPVKPFSTGIEGTYSNDCLGYISRVGISLASTSGDTSGNDSNDSLPSTDLSALNIFEIIAGSIFLLGGITIMKYRSRFENI